MLFLLLVPFGAYAAQTIETYTTPSVAQPVWFLPDPSTNLIAAEFTFDGGISLDPNGKEGLVNLLGGILLSGAGDRDAQDLAQFLKDHAIGIGINSTRDETIVSISAPSRFWPQATSILKDILFAPRFDTGEIERAKASQAAALRSDLSDPNWRAQRIVNGLVFEGSPYARPGAGTADTVTNLTQNDFRAVYKLIFGAKPVHAVFVGNADELRIDEALYSFASLPASAPDTDKSDYRRLTPPRQIFHEFDVPQSSLVYVLPGLPAQDKEYAAYTVLNALLGDGFGSRLMSALREESGLSYGVSNGQSDARHGALWIFSLQVGDKDTAKAAAILQREIGNTITKPFSKAEVKKAAESLAAQLPMGWTSSSAIAGQLGAAQRNGYSTDYLNEWQTKLRSVTPKHVQKMAQRLLQNKHSVMVTVGRTQPDGWTNVPHLPFVKE